MYLKVMPYRERAALCVHLDNNGKWRALARASNTIDEATLRSLSKRKSPTEAMLSMWDIQNHTVLEIFLVLGKIKQFRAMQILKELVDTEYHIHIDLNHLENEDEDNIEEQFNEIKINNDEICEKDLQLDMNNLNSPTDNIKRQFGAKSKLFVKLKDEVVQIVSNENNESSIVNNKLMPKPKSPLEFVSSSKVLTTSDISYVTESAGAIPQIPYEELQKATNNWDLKTRLGRGGFGIVFLGTWKFTKIAIKRLEQKVASSASQSEQIRQSITELHCLNAYRHDNILPVYGYSIGGPQPCLVYQYMSGGCLEKRLRIKDPKQVLKWDTRLNIAIGTARGLQFLHTIGDKPLIHGDIKSANILLDPNDNAKIGDFGLAKEGPDNNVSYIIVSKLHGTLPYLPDEFLRNRKFSTKVDTFSFGIVLFELATSLPVASTSRKDKLLRDHVENHEGDVFLLKDSRAEGGEREFVGLIETGKLCITNVRDRPEMVDVLIHLENICKQ